MIRVIILSAALLMQYIPYGSHSPVSGGGGGYVGPGDAITGAIAWWGLRCYNTAYTGNVADVFDSSTGTTTETLITCSAGGTLNETIHTLAVTCAVGCKVKTLYDQTQGLHCGSSAVCDFGQNTNSKRPALTTSCIGSLYCMTFASASSQELVSTVAQSINTQTQPYTWSITARQTTTAAGALIADNNEQVYFTATPALGATAGTNQTVGTTVNTWYAVQTVFSGASSFFYINGSSTSISPGTASTGASQKMGNDPFSEFLNGNIAEIGLWNIGFSSGQQSTMNSNQRAYWGF